MDQDMIRRVARALTDELARQGVWIGGDSPDDFNSIPVDGTVDFLPLARATIEAMRDPTDAMEEAGCMDDGRGGDTDSYFATKIYHAMIDAALTPSEREG